MKYYSLVLVRVSFSILFIFFLRDNATAQNYPTNPGFEAGKEDWGIFIAPENKGATPTFEIVQNNPHSGTSCAEINTTEPIRYTIYPKENLPVTPGDRYHIQAWVRFSATAQITKKNTPVIYVRATLLESPKKGITDPLGSIHIGLRGDVARQPDVYKLRIFTLLEGWNKIEAVIEIPPAVSLMGINLMLDGVTGAVFWDDLLVEKVGADAALTPVIPSA